MASGTVIHVAPVHLSGLLPNKQQFCAGVDVLRVTEEKHLLALSRNSELRPFQQNGGMSQQ